MDIHIGEVVISIGPEQPEPPALFQEPYYLMLTLFVQHLYL